MLVVFVAASTAPLLALVSLAVLAGRRKGLTGRAGYWRSVLYPLAPILGLLISVDLFVADLLDPEAGRPGVLIIVLIMGLGAAWYAFVLRRRPGGWAPHLDV